MSIAIESRSARWRVTVAYFGALTLAVTGLSWWACAGLTMPAEAREFRLSEVLPKQDIGREVDLNFFHISLWQARPLSAAPAPHQEPPAWKVVSVLRRNGDLVAVVTEENNEELRFLKVGERWQDGEVVSIDAAGMVVLWHSEEFRLEMAP